MKNSPKPHLHSVPAAPAPATTLQRAIALHQQGELRQAGALYLEVLETEPDNFDALHLLGVYALQTDDTLAAYDLISRAVAIDPGEAIAHTNLGVAQQRLRRYDDALASYRRALEIAPDSPMALNNYGSALLETGRVAESLHPFERALQIDPQHADAWNNLGKAQSDLRRYDDALLCLERALQLKPGYTAAHFNRGNALQYVNRTGEALASYRQALAREPGHVDANFNEGVCLLLQGEFEAGWLKYEWRWRKEAYRALQQGLTQPLWLGEQPLAGRTILVHAEQGFGDTLQFCRYVPLLAARGARVLLRAQPPLVSLLRTLLADTATVCADGEPLPPFDCHCPLMSLALVFGTTVDTVPPPPRWPAMDTERERTWAARLAAWPVKQPPQACRIGIVWAGSAGHANDACRSMPLARYLDLLALLPPHVQLVSLQKDPGAADRLRLERDGRIAHFPGEQRDFADTAALIGQLDAVVCVDTSVAHLAAAMGKPTWILLAHAPDWRWMLGRSDSPWYPTAWLVRQPRSGDWDSVVRQTAKELNAWIAAR